MEQPGVDVIIPAYNAAKFVVAAVESALRQEYPQVRVIIVDDGSSDNTLELLYRHYSDNSRVQICFHEQHQNLGVSKTRKEGLRHATGRYVAFLDADDLFLPGKLQRQVQAMESHPGAVMCHTGVDILKEIDSVHSNQYFQLAREAVVYNYRDEPHFLRENKVINSSSLVRRAVLDRVDFPQKQLFQFEDWVLWVLLAEHGSFIFLPEAYVHYRLHAASSSASLINQALKGQYSYLEFLLTVLVLTKTEEIQHQIRPLVREVVSALAAVYGGAAPGRPADGLSRALGKIFYDGPEGEIRRLEGQLDACRNRAAQLEEQLAWGEKEHSKAKRQLEGIRKSRFWGLYSRLSAIKKKIGS